MTSALPPSEIFEAHDASLRAIVSRRLDGHHEALAESVSGTSGPFTVDRALTRLWLELPTVLAWGFGGLFCGAVGGALLQVPGIPLFAAAGGGMIALANVVRRVPRDVRWEIAEQEAKMTSSAKTWALSLEEVVQIRRTRRVRVLFGRPLATRIQSKIVAQSAENSGDREATAEYGGSELLGDGHLLHFVLGLERALAERLLSSWPQTPFVVSAGALQLTIREETWEWARGEERREIVPGRDRISLRHDKGIAWLDIPSEGSEGTGWNIDTSELSHASLVMAMWRILSERTATDGGTLETNL